LVFLKEARSKLPRTSTQETNKPVSALLSQILVAYTIELDNEFEARMARAGYVGARLSLFAWTNLLCFVPPGGISVNDLAIQSLSSLDSLKTELGCLERWGFIMLQPKDASVTSQVIGKRNGWGSGQGILLNWIVRLTAKGKRAAEIWQQLWKEIEERWKKRLGK
jgi:hypothetical protein